MTTQHDMDVVISALEWYAHGGDTGEGWSEKKRQYIPEKAREALATAKALRERLGADADNMQMLEDAVVSAHDRQDAGRYALGFADGIKLAVRIMNGENPRLPRPEEPS